VVEEAVATAAQAVLVWVRSGTEACMNRFNGPAEDEKKDKAKARKEKPKATGPDGEHPPVKP
jgi:PTH1 family peptidyl-tRNA hydrolase